MAARLAERGARVVDADALARAALAPGTPAHDAVLERFPAAAAPGGGIDRGALARLVFADPAARAALEAIVHPLVAAATLAAIAGAGPGEVVVIDAPLLVETDARRRYGLDGLLVVDAPEELLLARLAERGMDPDDARARLAAQATRAERLRAADYVIVNIGSLEELRAMADAAWSWIATLAGPHDAAAPAAARAGNGRRGGGAAGDAGAPR